MKDDDDDLDQLQKATLSKDIEKKHVKKELLLKPTLLIKTHFTEVPKENVIHVLVDIRGKDRVSVASEKSSLLTGGRKTRGKKSGDVVKEQHGSQSCHTSTMSSAWLSSLSCFFLDTISGTKKNA